MSETVMKTRRVNAVDFLRGLVMVIMLLDHVREYVHADAFQFSPTDLSKTNVALFLTRWITHLCAPAFVLLAGTSIYLQRQRGKTVGELSKFLVKRGLWLIVLEFTVIRFAMYFNFDYSFFGIAEVIWVFGVSMLALAALIFLPVRIVGIIGVLMIALHNLLDNFRIPPEVSFTGSIAPTVWQSLWLILHQPGFVPLFDGVKMFVAYPLIPWIGVMAAGYWLGVVDEWENERRKRFLLGLGACLLGLFVIGSGLITYFTTRQTSLTLVALDFLNANKYPPSLLFLLMTLAPSLIILALADSIGENNFISRVLLTFGRVPLFYFILQMFLSHMFGLLLGYAFGKPYAHYFANFPASSSAPPEAGFNLAVVYACWLAGLAILYPICRRYDRVKQKRRSFPFSYL